MLSTHVNNTPSGEATLAVVLELSSKCWKLGFQDGQHDNPAIRNARADTANARLSEVVSAIEAQKMKWELPADCRVVVMYEAGQDAFWLYRALKRLGYEALIVDPASIPVERHARRAKTDRLDVLKLLSALMGYLRGERYRMRAVRVPEEAQEAERQVVRDRGTLQKEIQQHRDRIRKLLCTVGNWDGVPSDFLARLKADQVCCYDGQALPAQLKMRLLRECERLALVVQQLAELERTLVAQLPETTQARIAHLCKLKAVGSIGATRLVLELFWRKFHNRRELGACVGLVPQPYDSGNSRVDQGISKQGNKRVRALLVEMGWMWLRYQPQSALAQWFFKRTANAGQAKRSKRIAIVAVARRLVIALWRYLEDGIVPEGAAFKAV